MRIAMLHNRLRIEEEMLLDALEDLGAEVVAIDLRRTSFDLMNGEDWRQYDLVIDRSLSLTSSLTATRIIEVYGVRCMNPSHSIELCSDKLRTSIELERAAIPTPRVMIATSPEAALTAIEEHGYPVVLKPTIGSWGRLVARVNDRDAAEALLEHRSTLGSAQQGVFYIQEHIDKPGRDLRVFVVGGEAIAAISRSSDHWLTNTARGAEAHGLPLTPELADLGQRAAACVGSDVAAIDLLECPQRGLLVNEINHSMEFRNSISTTGVEIPRLIAEHALRIAGATSGKRRQEGALV